MGPTTKAISVTGGITFEELAAHYRVQALGLMAGGADYLLLETCQDTRNVKAGLIGIERAFEESGWRLPVAVSVTIEPTGTMLAGQDAEALAVSLVHADLLYVGLNCATGPALMADHLRTLSSSAAPASPASPTPACPTRRASTARAPRSSAKSSGASSTRAGSTWSAAAAARPTRTSPPSPTWRASAGRGRCRTTSARWSRGSRRSSSTADNRPLLVGERTNVLGSAGFKELVAAGDFEGAAEVGRAQVRAGAQVLDVCLQDPDRDELADVERLPRPAGARGQGAADDRLDRRRG